MAELGVFVRWITVLVYVPSETVTVIGSKHTSQSQRSSADTLAIAHYRDAGRDSSGCMSHEISRRTGLHSLALLDVSQTQHFQNRYGYTHRLREAPLTSLQSSGSLHVNHITVMCDWLKARAHDADGQREMRPSKRHSDYPEATGASELSVSRTSQVPFPRAMKTTDRVSTDDTHLQKVDSGVFHAIKSPAVESDGLELGGALRPGGAPSVFSLKHIGLLAHIASVGVVYGTVYGVIYAVLNNYLAMSATLVATAQALIRVPRALRMIFAVCSDCYPIFGYRRRPYLLIGWIMTFVSCFLMAVWPIGDPATTDPDASDNGIKLIFLMMFANLGTVIAFGASDGYMVELAQREPELTRGTVQSNVSTVRQVFMILSAFMTGLGLNGVDYGGSFSWTMGFNAIMGVCAAFSFVTIPLCWFCITEEKVSEGKSGSEFFKGLFKIIQSRVIFQLIALRFFRQIFSLFSVTADSLIQSLWAKVEPLNSGVADMLSSVISAVSIFIVKKYGLAWDWRLIVITCQVFVVALDCIPTFFTIWNVFRSQWFWLGVPLLAEFPNSIGDFIAGLYVVEVTDEGFEATIMGLMVSISAIGTPFATVMTKSVSSYFDIERPYIKKDDHHVHSQLTYAYIIAYIVNLFSLVFVVFWLPRQKAEVRALKRTGGSNKVLGSITVFYLVFAFCWTVMTNILSLSASTKCLRIAGGTGCKK